MLSSQAYGSGLGALRCPERNGIQRLLFRRLKGGIMRNLAFALAIIVSVATASDIEIGSDELPSSIPFCGG